MKNPSEILFNLAKKKLEEMNVAQTYIKQLEEIVFDREQEH